MKHKLFPILLAAEAALLVILALMGWLPDEASSLAAIMAFPFEQIGIGLRALSLSGALGNVLAMIAYIAVCLSPLLLLLAPRRRRLQVTDALLIPLCAGLFYVIYHMINPGLLVENLPQIDISIHKALLGAAVYSILLAYFVIRLLRLFYKSSAGKSYQYITALLCLFNVVFVYLIFGAGVSGLIETFKALPTVNAGSELALNYAFSAFKFIAGYLPYALNTLVVFEGIKLVRELSADRFSEEAVKRARRLSKLCGSALTATVLLNAAFNILQYLFAGMLYDINGFVYFPLFSIAFVLMALFLSRLIAENKALKEDYDSII